MTMLRGATNSRCAQSKKRRKKVAHKTRNAENEHKINAERATQVRRKEHEQTKRDGAKEKHAVLQHRLQCAKKVCAIGKEAMKKMSC